MDRLLERQPSMGRTALLKRRGTAPARITGSLACQCDTASSDRSSTPHLHVTDTGGRPASQPTPAARKPSRSDPDGVPGQTTQLEKATDDPGNQMSSSSMALPENRTGPPCRCGSLDNVDTELRQMVFDAMKKLDQRRLVEINQGVAEQARRNYCSMMDNCTNSGYLSGEEMARAHTKAQKMAVDMFECLREGKDATTSLDILENLKCDIAYERIHYVQSNNMKSKRLSLGEKLRKFTNK